MVHVGNTDFALALQGCPQAIDNFERHHNVPRKDVSVVIRRVSEIHGLKTGHTIELERAVSGEGRTRLCMTWLLRAVACSESACEQVVFNGMLALRGGAEGAALVRCLLYKFLSRDRVHEEVTCVTLRRISRWLMPLHERTDAALAHVQRGCATLQPLRWERCARLAHIGLQLLQPLRC